MSAFARLRAAFVARDRKNCASKLRSAFRSLVVVLFLSVGVPQLALAQTDGPTAKDQDILVFALLGFVGASLPLSGDSGSVSELGGFARSGLAAGGFDPGASPAGTPRRFDFSPGHGFVAGNWGGPSFDSYIDNSQAAFSGHSFTLRDALRFGRDDVAGIGNTRLNVVTRPDGSPNSVIWAERSYTKFNDNQSTTQSSGHTTTLSAGGNMRLGDRVVLGGFVVGRDAHATAVADWDTSPQIPAPRPRR